jgi:hypothetical protein
VFDAVKRSWSEVPANARPTPASGQSLVYDPGTGKLLLFGGYHGDRLGQNHYLSFLYQYPVDGEWAREFFNVSPQARAWQAASIMGGGMVIFGGYGGNPPRHHLREVWSFDLAGDRAWSRGATDGGPDMAGRPAVLPLDENGELLVFGRDGVSRPQSAGVWRLDLDADQWSRVKRPGEPPADFSACAANPWEQSFLVLRAPDPDQERETWGIWTYSAKGRTWSSPVESGGPAVGQGMGCAPDPANPASWICFGGVRRNQVSQETWVVAP